MAEGGNKPTDMAEVAARAEIEREVTVEVEERYRLSEEAAGRRDRAMRALVLSLTFALSVAIPILAGVLGGSVRLFLWAAGFR